MANITIEGTIKAYVLTFVFHDNGRMIVMGVYGTEERARQAIDVTDPNGTYKVTEWNVDDLEPNPPHRYAPWPGEPPRAKAQA